MNLVTSLLYSVLPRSFWRSEPQCVIQLSNRCAGRAQHTRPNLTTILTVSLTI